MRTRRIVRARLVGAAVTATLVLSGCGAVDTLREERDRQDFVLGAGDRLIEQGTARYVMTMQSSLRVVEDPPGRLFDPPRHVPLQGEIDFTSSRASVWAPQQPAEPAEPAEPGDADQPAEQAAPGPVAIFDDTRIFVRRHKRGVGAADPRDWASIDFGETGTRELEAVDERGGMGFNWINPAYMVSLVDGAFTGSIRTLGRETVRGVETTRYAGNYALEAAVRGRPGRSEPDPEAKVRALEQQLRAMGHPPAGDFPGQVWVDDQGVVHRFMIQLNRRADVANTVLTVVVIELFDAGQPVAVDVPAQNNVREFENHVQMLVDFDIPEPAA